MNMKKYWIVSTTLLLTDEHWGFFAFRKMLRPKLQLLWSCPLSFLIARCLEFESLDCRMDCRLDCLSLFPSRSPLDLTMLSECWIYEDKASFFFASCIFMSDVSRKNWEISCIQWCIVIPTHAIQNIEKSFFLFILIISFKPPFI